jgi:hypothetical protein
MQNVFRDAYWSVNCRIYHLVAHKQHPLPRRWPRFLTSNGHRQPLL